MKAWFRLFFKSIRVFVLFTGCTILFYYGMMWVNEEYQNYHRYDEPEGAALKVSNAVPEEDSSLLDRLMWFYINGE